MSINIRLYFDGAGWGDYSNANLSLSEEFQTVKIGSASQNWTVSRGYIIDPNSTDTEGQVRLSGNNSPAGTFDVPVKTAQDDNSYGSFSYQFFTGTTIYEAKGEAIPYFEHGTIPEGVTVSPDDHAEIVDGELNFTIQGEVTKRYQALLNNVDEGPPFLGVGIFEKTGITESQELDVEEVAGEPPLVEEPSYAENGRLVLFGQDGGADSANFSLPEWTAGGVYLIPPSGTIGITANVLLGFWKQIGFRSSDGRALPPGNWVVQVYSESAWVDVAGYVIGENQHSSGVMPCFIGKTGQREFRLRMAVDANAPSPPTNGTDLPSDGGTAQAEDEVPSEITPGEGYPEPPEKPTPPTWEDQPEITEADTEACPCSTWYVDIAEQIQWAGYQMSTELEYVGDSIQWVGDVLDQRLEELTLEVRGIRAALEEIADKPPVEVSVESGYSHSVQYPVSGCAGQEIDQYLDGRY